MNVELAWPWMLAALPLPLTHVVVKAGTGRQADDLVALDLHLNELQDFFALRF